MMGGYPIIFVLVVACVPLSSGKFKTIMKTYGDWGFQPGVFFEIFELVLDY